jgi:hypothetical protein
VAPTKAKKPLAHGEGPADPDAIEQPPLEPPGAAEFPPLSLEVPALVASPVSVDDVLTVVLAAEPLPVALLALLPVAALVSVPVVGGLVVALLVLPVVLVSVPVVADPPLALEPPPLIVASSSVAPASGTLTLPPASAPVIASKTSWAISIAPAVLVCSPSESFSGGLM